MERQILGLTAQPMQLNAESQVKGKILCQKTKQRDGGMAQQQRARAALPEDPSWSPAPMRGSSQLPLAPVLWNPVSSWGLSEHPRIHVTLTQAHSKIKNKPFEKHKLVLRNHPGKAVFLSFTGMCLQIPMYLHIREHAYI